MRWQDRARENPTGPEATMGQTTTPSHADVCAQRVEVGSRKMGGVEVGSEEQRGMRRQETWLTEFKELTGPQPI